MDYNASMYNGAYQYKPEQQGYNYSISSDQTSGYNVQQSTQGYGYWGTFNAGNGGDTTAQNQESANYGYSYGGYGNNTSEYNYEYWNTVSQEQWTADNGSHTQDYQNFNQSFEQNAIGYEHMASVASTDSVVYGGDLGVNGPLGEADPVPEYVYGTNIIRSRGRGRGSSRGLGRGTPANWDNTAGETSTNFSAGRGGVASRGGPGRGRGGPANERGALINVGGGPTGYRGGLTNTRGGHSSARGFIPNTGGARGSFPSGRGSRGAISVRGSFSGGRGASRGAFSHGIGNAIIARGGATNSRGAAAGLVYTRGRGRAVRGGTAMVLGPVAGRGRGWASKPESSEVLLTTVTFQMESLSPVSPIQAFIERWKTFALKFTDCGNAVSNIECSLRASKINILQLNFDCKFLTKCATYSIFTGVLNISKYSPSKSALEAIFLARGIGLSKKSAKMDCYEKAYKLLINSRVQEIMNQKDCGEEFLIQEVKNIYKENPNCFTEMLKKSEALAEMDATKTIQSAGRSGTKDDRKRNSNIKSAGPTAKKAKFGDFSDILENKNLSLAPSKKIGLVMRNSDPLFEKLKKLKELLKDEGITKLHIVPKIDQLAHKAAIHILNVFRFQDVPILGFENKMPVYCEVYFDGVFMTSGAPHFNRNAAMQNAYNKFAAILYVTCLEEIVTCPKVWRPFMGEDLDIADVITKRLGEDNNALYTSNLANMRQMMQSNPDVSLSVDKIVLTEHESDKDIQNGFKALELSATRNLMLLECEIVREPDLKFTCTLSLNGRILASRTHSTKNGAKRVCSEAAMNEMKKKQDFIYVTTNFIGHTITKSELLQKAVIKKEAGEPPAKIVLKKQELKDDPATNTLEARIKQEEDRMRNEHIENLPENIEVKPLLPWMAAAMYEIIDDYYKKITLEDLMVNVSEMTKSQRDMVTTCASKMGLRVITKLKTPHDSSLLRRTITAQDMSKMLQLHGGISGRYKLVKCTNPCSQEDLNKFREECLRQHQLLVDARNKDDTEELTEKVIEPVKQAANNEQVIAVATEVKGENNDDTQSTPEPPAQSLKPSSVAIVSQSKPVTFSGARPLMASPFPVPRGIRAPRHLFDHRMPHFRPPRMFRPRF